MAKLPRPSAHLARDRLVNLTSIFNQLAYPKYWSFETSNVFFIQVRQVQSYGYHIFSYATKGTEVMGH